MTTEQKEKIVKQIPEKARKLYKDFYNLGLKGNSNIIIDNSEEFSEEEVTVAQTIRLLGILIGRLYEDTLWDELPTYKDDIKQLYDNLNY